MLNFVSQHRVFVWSETGLISFSSLLFGGTPAMSSSITPFKLFVMQTFIDVNKCFNSSHPLYSFLSGSNVQS